MKRTRKRIGSLLLSVCMVMTMLPTVAFADATSQIIAFANLTEAVTLQTVEWGTTVDALNLPSDLMATVTTGSAITVTVNGWSSNPTYDGDTEGGYLFTPTLDLPAEITLAEGVTLPQITVTVKAGMPLLGAGAGIDITDAFTDAKFRAVVRTKLGKTADEPIFDTDNFASVTSLNVNSMSITSLAGIEYFTALTILICDGNQLSALDVSKNIKLESLHCNGNQLSALDVSKNTALTFLSCETNQLIALDVSKNTALTELYCSENQLTKLDVSNNTALMLLECNNNQLSTLDVSQNTALILLDCGVNKLSTLDVSNNTTLSELYCSTNQLSALDANINLNILYCTHNYMLDDSVITGIDKDHMSNFGFDPQNIRADITDAFPDANFLAVVRTKLGKAADARIYDTDDFASIKSLNAMDKNIESLEGIAYFKALTELYCNNNQLTELDVSHNTKLTWLNCSYNQLSALDVDSNTALTNLYCYNNQLNALNVSNNTALTALNCSNNQLTELDVSHNTALELLACYDNQLNALDVSHNTALIDLACSNNRLTTLDVSNNKALSGLYCSYNYMPDDSAITGLNKLLTTKLTFEPQNTSTSTYVVTVNSGTSSASTAMANATITITANTPDHGKRFKAWTVVSGGITLANAQALSTTFTMPANIVEVTATYEDIPVAAKLVTGVTLNKTVLSLYSNTGTKTENLTATITPADATDKSVTWQSSNASVATVDEIGRVTAVGNGTANITVTTTDGGYTTLCNVVVSTYTSGGGSDDDSDNASGGSSGGSSGNGSGGGPSSSGSSPENTATLKENQPNQPVTAVSSVTATAGTNGVASASIPDKAVTDAISKAQTQGTKQEQTEKGISIGLNVTMPEGATALTATLSQNALNSLVDAGVTNLEINGSPVTVHFDQKALREIQKQTSGDVNIAITQQETISETAKKIIGTRPVYDITVSYGNNSTVSSFGEGGATIAIPYTPANGEVISGLYAVYVDEKGNPTRVEGSSYDAKSGTILFTTPHFSLYGVGYTAPIEKLTDISSHWAKASIDYIRDKGMIDKATETTFAPDLFMPRGTLVVALGRLTGEDVSRYTTSRFTDVEAGSISQPYIEWAYEKGILHGIGNDQFAPERAITREEIAVIIANFTKATGYNLPVVGEATAYTDDSSIGEDYKTAVTAMQQAGIMTGGTGNKFNPKSNATRAEVSSMLHRYIKLIVE